MRRATCLGFVALLALRTLPAAARVHHRVPAFEPTDLDLEDPHTLELGLQFGVLARDGDPDVRVFSPDFELDFGLTSRVELDVDGALSFDRTDGKFSFGRDNLWTSTKLDFITERDPLDEGRVWALGMQLGPRLPTAHGSVGTGFGAVLLGARMAPPWHVVVNAGSFLEPRDRSVNTRSCSLLGGVDVDYDLDAANRWSLLGELGGSYSLGPDPHDVHTTFGFDLAATAWLDLSLVGFYGFLHGGDRYGAFLGVTPKFATEAATGSDGP